MFSRRVHQVRAATRALPLPRIWDCLLKKHKNYVLVVGANRVVEIYIELLGCDICDSRLRLDHLELHHTLDHARASASIVFG